MSSTHSLANAQVRPGNPGVKKLSYSFLQKARLYKHSKQNPHLKARDLSLWFKVEFGLEIPRSTIYDIIKNPKFDFDLDTMTLVDQAKRKDRKGQNPVLEDALVRYYMLSSETPDTFRRDLLLQKAALLWQRIDALRDKPFPKLGVKWQDKFFVRTALRTRKMTPPVPPSTPCLMAATPADLQRALAPFAACDRFNADETGLLWKQIPEAAAAAATVRPQTAAAAAPRITLVLACNADASQRLDIWAVGRSRAPHSFARRPAVASLGVVWRYNPTAVVTLLEFVAYLYWFDGQMDGRRVALILTTTALHRAAVALLDKKRRPLVNTTVVWVAPSPPSQQQQHTYVNAHQPLDHGLTCALKALWRRLWLQYILAQYNARASYFDHYHLHKALTWLHVAWTEHLSAASIQASFSRAAGEPILHNSCGSVLPELADPAVSDMIQTLAGVGLLQAPMSAEEFISPVDETVRYEPTLLSLPDWEVAIVAEEINREHAERIYNNVTNNEDDVSLSSMRSDGNEVNDDSESVLAASMEVEVRKTLSALAFVDQFLYAYPTLEARDHYQDSVKSMISTLEGKLAELHMTNNS